MADPLVYTEVQHEGAVIWIDGQRWIIDSVDVMEGEPGCAADAVAYLSPIPDAVADSPQ